MKDVREEDLKNENETKIDLVRKIITVKEQGLKFLSGTEVILAEIISGTISRDIHGNEFEATESEYTVYCDTTDPEVVRLYRKIDGAFYELFSCTKELITFEDAPEKTHSVYDDI